MYYLGIDLGTTNSVGIIYNQVNDALEVVKIDDVDEILPSIVNYLDDEIIVGNDAKLGAIIYPETTIRSVKRLMGEDTKITVNDISKSPEEVSSDILRKIKEMAEQQVNEEFDEVVITHPAYFNDKQILATKKAGELAGFKNVYLLSEPLAAAIEYGYKQAYAQTLLVYDLGGGTFDVCVLSVSKDENGQEVFQELADIGDMNIGGDDFDAEIIKLLKDEFKKINNVDIDDLETLERKRSMQKLKQEAEQVKKKLSTVAKVNVSMNPLVIHNGVPLSLNVEITREQFENLIRKYVDRTRDIIEDVLQRSGKTIEEINKVILVGGSTMVPIVKRTVAGYVKEPYNATDPAKSVAMGASIYNYLIHLPKSNVHIGQITRHVFGTEAVVNTETMQKQLIPIIPLGSEVPTKVVDDKFGNMIGAKAVAVDVFQWSQGDEDNKQYIGTVNLDGLDGQTKLEITYEISEDNIFGVTVRDTKSNKVVQNIFDRDTVGVKKETTVRNYQEVNIVFVIDTTGSMDMYSNAVKERAIEFTEILKNKDIDYKLGLVGFGDLYEKERPVIHGFTDDIQKFQNRVKNLPKNYGGDIPESSLDAIISALTLIDNRKSETAKNIFILITDAPPHVPTFDGKEVTDVCEMLKNKNVSTYVVARRDEASKMAYEPLTENDGKYYNMTEKFTDILDSIAVSITELVRL